MSEVALTKGHKETDAFDALDIERQRFDLFMVQQVHIFFADLVKVVNPFDFHGFGFYPMAIFPIAAIGADFADVDFRIKIGGEGIAMVAAIAVLNIYVMDFIKVMLLGISGKNTGHTWVKAAA